MTQYDKGDASKDTESTPKEVSQAWHDARDDAAKRVGGVSQRIVMTKMMILVDQTTVASRTRCLKRG